MDAVIRRRRSLLIAVVFAAACGGARGGAVGMSDKVAAGTSARDAGGTAIVDGAVALPASYRTTFAKVSKTRFVSQGHAAGRWEVDVWANDIAQKALAARAREVPVGAVVVEEHFERGKSDQGPIMVMEKKAAGFSPEHGDWRYAVIGSQGQLVRDGLIDTCAGCHDASSMDGLFPILD